MTSPIQTAREHMATIDALERVERGRRAAEDLELLRRWPGWGPLAPVLDVGATGTLAVLADQVADRHTGEEHDAAVQATTTAFYTDPVIAQVMWRLAESLGFQGGEVLEPGCGSGRFLAAVPSEFPVTLTGVERDPFSARMAAALHPGATVLVGSLQDTVLRDDHFDLVIGNVPFSGDRIYSRGELTRHSGGSGLALHNYFLWRGLAACRPGGILVAITSRYTLDAQSGSEESWHHSDSRGTYGQRRRHRHGFRHTLEDLGEFLGAIRLPTGAHRDAGTEVVSDIVVFRRRPEEIAGPTEEARAADEREEWWDTVEVPHPDGPSAVREKTVVNRYFHNRPEMVVGEMDVASGGQYHKGDLRVLCPPEEFYRRLADAVDALVVETVGNGRTWQPRRDLIAEQVSALGVDLDVVGGESREGRFVVGKDDAVYRVEAGRAIPVARTGKELRRLIALRDSALALLELESEADLPDAAMVGRRAETLALYEEYVASHGPLNRATVKMGAADPETGIVTINRTRPRMEGFRNDPDALTVLALEVYDDEQGTAEPAPILKGRVNLRPARPTQTDTPSEAVAVSMDALGRVDLDMVTGLLGLADTEEAKTVLRSTGAAFEDHASPDHWVPAGTYLSGQVRAKHEAAVGVAAEDPQRWAANVAALAAVIPRDIGPDEILVRLGAPWVPASDIADFCREVLERYATVLRDPVTGAWEVPSARDGGRPPAHVMARYGTPDFSPLRLVEMALNSQIPVATTSVWEGGRERKVKNHDGTLLAIDRTQALNVAFADWLWSAASRTERLVRAYNARFNATVAPVFDGSSLTFPGMAAEFTPYSHQTDIAARIIASRRAACGYAPGAGKTEAVAMAMMKLRQLGLVNKPAVVVPNHLVEQFAVQVKTVFPLARILAASKEDFAPDRRRLFVAKAATGTWDLIVMPLTGFGMIPLHPDTEASYLDGVIHETRKVLASTNTRTKAAGRTLNKLEERRRNLLHSRRDDQVTFEMTGIDALAIDEAHLFKNKAVATKTVGLSMSSSKRAEDLAAKLAYLDTRNPTGHIVSLWSGTIVSNTLLEVFVMQSYCQPEVLEEMGVANFDDWAGQFIAWESAVEVAPDGGSFRLQQRPTVVNVPELRSMLALFLDARDEDRLGLPRPARHDETVVVPISPEQKAFVKYLVQYAEDIKNGKANGKADMMLTVVRLGRMAALDGRLVGLETTAQTKLMTAADRIASRYQETREVPVTIKGEPAMRSGVQLVFSDLGTPGPDGSSVYGWVRDLLVERGVPREEIAFIHDAKTDGARTTLIKAVRSGRVAVLLGSTEKLGVGTNVQDLVTDMHHLDVPWRPADLQQREGRGWRPGNLTGHVNVWRYVTEGTFDAYTWQMLEKKLRWISVVLCGTGGERTVGDIDSVVIAYAQLKALATGQPILLELAQAEAELARLARLARAHRRSMSEMNEDARRMTERAAEYRYEHKRWTAVLASYKAGDDRIDPTGLFAGSDAERFLRTLRDVAVKGTTYVPLAVDGVSLRVTQAKTPKGKPAVEVETSGYPSAHVGLYGAYALGRVDPVELLNEVRGVLARAGSSAEFYQRSAERLDQEAAEHAAANAEPFAHRDELAAAEARVLAVQAQINATMADEGAAVAA